MKYKIDIHTICCDEIKIAKFALQYWKKFANHVYVYDNGSTDGCLEFFAQYPDFITVIPFKTDGFQDEVNEKIKGECWKDSTADWCVVTEFDEFIYCPDWDAELDSFVENNIVLAGEQIYNVVTDDFPIYDEKLLIHQQENTKGYFYPSFGKVCIINPQKCKEIIYSPGGHSNRHTIDGNFSISKNIYLFHCKNLGLDYLIKRYRYNDSKQSAHNKAMGWGFQYRNSDEKIKQDFLRDKNNSKDLPKV